MRFGMLLGMELKVGIGVEEGPPGLKAHFCEVTWLKTKGQRSSRGQVALEMFYGHQIW